MTTQEFRNLKRGDIIINQMGSSSVTVEENYGAAGVVVNRPQVITNPSEWSLVLRANYSNPEQKLDLEPDEDCIILNLKNGEVRQWCKKIDG
jgi:hypothetical protein